MIDTKELRKVLARHGTSVINEDEVLELLDRLEAAEKSDTESLMMYRKARDERDALRAELDALKAWKEEVEKQEPLAWLIDWADEPDLGHYFSESAVDEDSGRSRPLFLHPVPASVPERITHDQAPHVYSQEAAEGYADGWNACVKKIVAAAPQNCIKAAMEAQREGCAEIVLQAAHKAADCNNLRDYELLRALSIEVAKAPEVKP